MTLSSIVEATRHGWRAVLAGLLIGLAGGYAFSALSPTTYAATADVYVAASDLKGGGADTYGTGLLMQQRIASYQRLVVSDQVLTRVSAGRAQPVSAANVVATSPSGSSIISVTAVQPDAVAAAVVANEVAQQFSRVIGELDRPAGSGGPAPAVAAVIREAAPSPSPVTPQTGMNLILGSLIGVLGSTMFVLVRAATDDTVRTLGGLVAIAGGTALGLESQRGPRRRRDHGGAPARADEALRRTHVMLRLACRRQRQDRVLVLCSAKRGEGATALAGSLGRLAAQTLRVLLIDADHGHASDGRSRDSDSRRAGIGPEGTDAGATAGLLHVLAGEDVSCGAPHLVEPAALEALIDDARGSYDLVLIDTPPLLDVPETASICRFADSVVMVCRDGRTRERELREAIELLGLSGTPVLGSILTSPSRARDADERGDVRQQAPPGAGPAHADADPVRG